MLGLAAVLVAGCSPATSDVSGTIKLNGQAPKMSGLEVVFLGPGARPMSAPIDPDGTYTIKDVPAGDRSVCFAYAPPELAATKGKSRLTQPGKDGALPKSNVPDNLKNPVPDHLREFSTSNIIYKVVAGQKNVFDYDIK